MLMRLFFLCLFITTFTGCDSEKPREIEWQLPLSVPTDPHASEKGKQLPDWAAANQGKATIVFLEKSTTRIFEVTLENNSKKLKNGWDIELQGLAQGVRIKNHTFIDDDSISNPAGFVAIYYHKTLMYEGWLYQDFPELFGMDNSHWKVWIKDVTMPPSSQEDDNMLP